MKDNISCKKFKDMDIKKSEHYSQRRKVISIASFAVLIIFFTVVTIALWKPLTGTFSQPEKFRDWINAKGIMGEIIFMGMMILQVIFPIIPGEPMELGAGYAFGNIEGTLLCLGGAAIGSTIVYLFVKQLGIKIVEAFISREKISTLKFINNSKNLDVLTFILFFIPGTPKDMITYFIGLTPMKLRTFLIISSIARIPSVITSTMAGNALGTQNYAMAVTVFIITGIIGIMGIGLYNRISKQN